MYIPISLHFGSYRNIFDKHAGHQSRPVTHRPIVGTAVGVRRLLDGRQDQKNNGFKLNILPYLNDLLQQL